MLFQDKFLIDISRAINATRMQFGKLKTLAFHTCKIEFVSNVLFLKLVAFNVKIKVKFKKSFRPQSDPLIQC